MRRERKDIQEVEGIITGKIRYGKGSYKMVGVYVNGDMERKLEELDEWVEEGERSNGNNNWGDFNARTGQEGGRLEGIEGEEEEEIKRNSKDKKVNKEERKLMEWIRERGWSILNGGVEGDEEEYWTYIGGRGESVIDYILVKEEIKEEIESLEIRDYIESDHHPLVIKGGDEERGVEEIKEEKCIGGYGMR